MVFFFFSLMIITHVTWMNGLEISLERNADGKDTCCAKLYCAHNTKEDNEMSALVNMSVYKISELEGKVFLASFSESDSKVPDYEVTGSKVNGQFSQFFGELTVSFTKSSDCVGTVFACDVYYTNRKGLIEKKEKQTKPMDQENHKPLIRMTLEAKTPEIDTTINRMSEFLKSFKDFNKINSADLKMQLQFSTVDKTSNQTNGQIAHARKLPAEQRSVIFANEVDLIKTMMSNITTEQEANFLKHENAINKILLTVNDVSDKLKTLNETNHKQNISSTFEYILNMFNDLRNETNKSLSELQSSFGDISLTVQRLSEQSNYTHYLNRSLNQNNISIKKIENIVSKQNIHNQQIDASNKKRFEEQERLINKLSLTLSPINDTLVIKKDLESASFKIQNLIEKYKEIDTLHTKLFQTKLDIANLRCTHENSTQYLEVKLDDNVVTLCDTQTDGGGWFLIQRRMNGDENFTRNWNDYKNGFGSISGDFWIGNDMISKLTNSGFNELRFDLKYQGKKYYAVHRGFKVENEAAKYKLGSTSFISGNAGDGFKWHNGYKFSTFDSDNDGRSNGNCALARKGGWWYTNCNDFSFDGEKGSKLKNDIHFHGITGYTDVFDFVEMKVRQI